MAKLKNDKNAKIGQKVSGRDQFGNDVIGLIINVDDKEGTLDLVNPTVQVCQVKAEDFLPLKD